MKPLFFAVGLATLGLVMAVVTAASRHGDRDRDNDERGVTLPNHLGVPTDNLITLACLPEDATATNPYPHCISFRQVSTPGVQATTDYTIPGSGCAFIYGSSVISDASGRAAKADHLTSGLFLSYIPAVSVGNAPHLSDAQLHGYLTH